MLLIITTTRNPATDLGFLLHKHPAKLQEFEIPQGIAHVFYPEVSDERCTIALLLDIDPVGMTRSKSSDSQAFSLGQYVNDRPYAASSLLSAALVKAFGSAMNGKCKDKPELVETPFPLEVKIAVLSVRGGETMLRRLFEPLGYTIETTQHELDAQFPAWGQSRYFSATFKNTITIQDALRHFYVLIPVLDNNKHYWVSREEVDKLLEKGGEWLQQHPEKELITRRYLRNQRVLMNEALDVLLKEEQPVAETEEQQETAEELEAKKRIHDVRLETVRDELLKDGIKKVIDLGCGEGKLLRLLLPEKQFEYILGMDISMQSLRNASYRLKLDRMAPRQRERIELILGSLTYRDKRLEGFDAAALVEVIEHLDEPRLRALEKVVFRFARPRKVIITTPNSEYNVLFETLPAGEFRHNDHRFEWTRSQFENWGNKVALEFGYTVVFRPLGEEHEQLGAISQMAVFERGQER